MSAFQVGSACYPSAEAAAAASASSSIGSVVTHGQAAYVVGVQGVTSDSITYSLQPAGGGAALQVVSSYMAQPCGLLQAADAVSLGWYVVAAWAVAWGFAYLAKFVSRGWDDGDA